MARKPWGAFRNCSTLRRCDGFLGWTLVNGFVVDGVSGSGGGMWLCEDVYS